MLDILYEDNHIIVAYKPKGILSQSDGSNKDDMLTLIKEYIKVKYNKPGNVFLGLVHRLDINTSGVMVFARTSKAAARLHDQIKNNEFNKKYKAVVEGIISNDEFIVLENYIKKDEKLRKAYICDDGLFSKLEYRALKNFKINSIDVTLVDIILHTGRFHQIRCQMANIKHPLYGDVKYGSNNNIQYEEFPLDAYYLSFNHPITKERLEFKYKG